MLIQNTYEAKIKEAKTVRTQRQTQSAQSAKPRSVHKKWVIGSNHYGPHKNYQRDFQFFSMDDIPPAKKAAHDAACDFVDPDLLGLKKRDWNGGTKVPKYPHLEETFERKITKIRIGLLDHPVQKEKQNKIWTGTETRDKYTDWNVSTAQDLIERKKMLDDETNHAMRMTSKHFNKLEAYVKPTDYTTNLNNNLRALKTEEQWLRTTIRDKYKYDNPNATRERVDGAVHRLTDEHKIKHAKPQSENEAANLTFKPDLTRTLKHPKEFNLHATTLQIFAGSQDVTEGPHTKTEAIFRSVPQTYLISNKKNKAVEDTWQITAEEEERIENVKRVLKSKQQHQEDHSPSLREKDS